MSSIVFMLSVMPDCGGGGNFSDLPVVLLTVAISGVILIILDIFANILHIKISNGFSYTPISWADIKTIIDDSFLGFVGSTFICTSLIVGLVAGVYWIIITL